MGCIGPSGKLLCYDKSKKNKQYKHCIIPCMFDCWDDPVVHLLLLKSSISTSGNKRFLILVRATTCPCYSSFGSTDHFFRAQKGRQIWRPCFVDTGPTSWGKTPIEAVRPNSGPFAGDSLNRYSWDLTFEAGASTCYYYFSTYQCDQTTKLLFWYLTICSSVN